MGNVTQFIVTFPLIFDDIISIMNAAHYKIVCGLK
ncbi:hypothetical protein SERP1991 [Staphylococcus epidermidis RP62A]|uniref:Uncharacterized protein n=1 Tax=Staphylococcus epidermidis (strain ATCC 35984 / DSM 28319 / BCRC 17069 / CCUG 31568 / BM 3577 / RP62A) TaxID=176279 RepID=Q5HLJ6_STAEQ|nr:hypothetical protein SERP1991 [Staphylococcus epidermidis RP62A]EES57230.1 hypothetical protein HMPREF0789_2175 [Staphylococcus epidermidis BCM-HMP0060]